MFTEVIVAIYDTDEDAEHAVAEMLAAHVPESAIHRHTQADLPAAVPNAHPDEPEHGGFWSRLFGFHPTEHAAYDRALHNGGNVVTVTTVPDHDFGPVMAILERHNPIDLDERPGSFVGIAHSPDPLVSGTDNVPKPNPDSPRVRRLTVTPTAS